MHFRGKFMESMVLDRFRDVDEKDMKRGECKKIKRPT